MIRLTLNEQNDSAAHLFNQDTILIGAEPSQVNLVLSGPEIQPIHLKISKQNDFHIIINYANDPFISINGHPFGKKLLNTGDVIVIHQTTLLFETLVAINETETCCAKDSLEVLLESKIKQQEWITAQDSCPLSQENRQAFSQFTLPFEHEVEMLKEHEWKENSLDHYLKSIETTFHEAHQKPLLPVESKLAEKTLPETNFLSIERKKTVSLKDDYLRDLEDDHQDVHKGPFEQLPIDSNHLYQAWKWVLLFIFSLITIATIAGTIIYFSVSDKSEAQETKVAQGIADIAMALTHAQLSNLIPPNQNWADVDFLKSNLQAILTDTPSYAAQIDAQGQFNCCPYSLRIYTSNNLSHFLLIAQPDPGVLYWLIPQSIIVLDSQLMELRTLKDVRSLNRLLANRDPLDGINGKEITNLIKQGNLVRLSTLANETGQISFAPPKNLAWVRPGAENLIYNAPRYYRLGQTLMQKALSLSTSKGSSQEVAALKQAVENFAWLNHLILYSDQGKKSALLTRQGFSMFAPSNKLLFGYLSFNAQGKIYQVNLLKDDDELKDTALVNMPKDNEIIAFQSPQEMENKEEASRLKNEERLTVDRNHPIYIQLQVLVTARENELKPLISSLFALFNQELQTPRFQFQAEFQNLSQLYLIADTKHKQALKEALDTLYHQYEEMPVNQFLAFAKELRLDQLMQHKDHSLTLVSQDCQQNIETILTHVEKSQSLAELDNLINIACTWLSFDYIKDPHELIKYQNLLRNQLLQQLEQHLLSKKHFANLKREDREILEHLLNQERLIKPEERDFFLGEFEELFASQ